ncbi:ATP-binding protein [Flavisolibacter nicotianae]|uniref:ATP-binding protein n=1 Tax=Flavisolibacter nicotianae TaxID=2364882 RepID=UPI000EACEB28|nr:ATP-binding protein [Flavisolibacter nicotianae]
MKTQELIRVTLQNEMDLILAHKRSMRLAELAGLSLSAQTTFATAVSEVSRNTIEHGKNGCLVLSITEAQREKYIVAKILDEEQQHQKYEGLAFAKRLVSKYNISTTEKQTSIELYYSIPFADKLDAQKLDEWKRVFRSEPPLSPYEEIKRKNELLQDLAQKLQESEQQYKMLTNALPLIIFSLSDKGELIYANEWLKRFTGMTTSQLNASRWKEVVHPEDYDSFSILVKQEVPLGASTIKTQCRLRHKGDEDYYWHLVSISPLNDEKGKLLYWIGYFVDINAQKMVEETLQNNKELKETQARLRENQAALEHNITELNRSNLELQQFAYVASHDLQEPARKISFYSDFLLSKYEPVLDEKGRDYLNNMQAASRRMRSLINDLLAFAQVERKAVQFKKINLNQVTHNALQDLEMLIEEKGAIVHIDPLPLIEADENMLHQLFENLISNGIKYARDNVKPEIKVWGETDNNDLRIHINDNGIGFEEKFLPQMFTLFQRLHSTQKYEGTGLGLAICHKIVALHGGNITAQSRLGKGSTFVITLPINHSAVYEKQRH